MDRCYLDPLYYMEANLWIRTQKQQLIPLKLNYPQQVVYDRLMEQRRQGKPIRAVILKARREGVSTLIEGIMFHHTATHQNVNSLVIADDEDSTETLFRMSQLYYERLPEFLKPMTKYSNRKELLFDDPEGKGRGLGSGVRLGTAGKTNIGRAPTFHIVHRSEVAFWKNAETLILGLEQAVPNEPDTMIIDESTANGMGGYFYEQYHKAKAGKSDYIDIFLPWYIYPDYRTSLSKLEPQYRLPDDDLGASGLKLIPEEKQMKDLYHLDDQQLAWRRWCINNKCLVKGDWLDPSTWDGFHQEYPANDIECFVMSGRPVFPNQAIVDYLEQCKKNPPIATGNIEFIMESVGPDKRQVKFEKAAKGPLRVWKWPEKYHEYIISADVAEGVRGGSYSVISVFDRHDTAQSAEWHGHTRPDTLAYEMYRIAKFWNKGMLCPEVNGHGASTRDALVRIVGEDEEPMQIYERQQLDSMTGQPMKKYGWLTNDNSRPVLINSLVGMIRNRTLNCWNEDFFLEAKGMQYDEEGRADHQQGEFDDRIFALGIGIQVHQRTPMTGRAIPKTYPSEDARRIQREIRAAIKERKDPYLTQEEIIDELDAEDGVGEEDWVVA